MESEKIIEFLRSTPNSNARDIGKKLSLDKKVVNKHLYSLKKEGKAVSVGETPPLWSLSGAPTVEGKTERPKTPSPTSVEKKKHTIVVGDNGVGSVAPPEQKTTSGQSSSSGKSASLWRQDYQKKTFMLGWCFDEGLEPNAVKFFRATSEKELLQHLLKNYKKFSDTSFEKEFLLRANCTSITIIDQLIHNIEDSSVDGDSQARVFCWEVNDIHEI